MRARRKLSSIIAVSLLFVAGAGFALAEMAFEKVIDLGEGEQLRISDNADSVLTLTLTSDGQLSESYSLANASTDEDSITQHKFCAECEPAFFVPAYDRSSTYGATTGIVVWNNPWWRLSILPLSRADAEDSDGDGVSEIVDYTVVDQQERKTIYRFDNGFLVKRE